MIFLDCFLLQFEAASPRKCLCSSGPSAGDGPGRPHRPHSTCSRPSLSGTAPAPPPQWLPRTLTPGPLGGPSAWLLSLVNAVSNPLRESPPKDPLLVRARLTCPKPCRSSPGMMTPDDPTDRVFAVVIRRIWNPSDFSHTVPAQAFSRIRAVVLGGAVRRGLGVAACLPAVGGCQGRAGVSGQASLVHMLSSRLTLDDSLASRQPVSSPGPPTPGRWEH